METGRSPFARLHAAALLGFGVLALLFVLTKAAKAEEAPLADTERLIVLGGDLTEIVFELGAGDRIVAVDDTSLYPAKTADLPKLGYVRRLSPEGILSMEPDGILASADAGPAATMERLRAAGVPTVTVAAEDSLAGLSSKIVQVGEALGKQADAQTLDTAIRTRIDDIQSRITALEGVRKPRVLFLLSLSQGAPTASGSGTAADAMIALAGGENAITGYEGYKPLSLEAAIAARSDIVVMMDHALAAAGGRDAVLAHPAIAATPAGRSGRVLAIDGLLVLGFGPRTPEAVELLAKEFYPEASF